MGNPPKDSQQYVDKLKANAASKRAVCWAKFVKSAKVKRILRERTKGLVEELDQKTQIYAGTEPTGT